MGLFISQSIVYGLHNYNHNILFEDEFTSQIFNYGLDLLSRVNVLEGYVKPKTFWNVFCNIN